MHKTPIIIALTGGEPSGIGSELVDSFIEGFESFESFEKFKDVQFMYIGDLNLLRIHTQSYFKTQGKYHQIDVLQPVVLGVLNAENNQYVKQILRTAATLAMSVEIKKVDAIVTLPVHKGILNKNNENESEKNQIAYFSGHTEFFAHQAGLKNDEVLMLLAGMDKNKTNPLRIALATTHIPLRSVHEHLNIDRLIHMLKLLHQGLKTQFHINNPKIHVCGLNPHAGDDGALGIEEIAVITPAIVAMQQQGYDVEGPFSADTIFHHQNVDAFLAMYHDQGLPVLKYATFGHAVNITLGLPFIRTSVDHGTALDIAGKGLADIGSLKIAIETAIYCAKGKIGDVR